MEIFSKNVVMLICLVKVVALGFDLFNNISGFYKQK